MQLTKTSAMIRQIELLNSGLDRTLFKNEFTGACSFHCPCFLCCGPSQFYNVYYLLIVQLLDKTGVPLDYKLRAVYYKLRDEV